MNLLAHGSDGACENSKSSQTSGARATFSSMLQLAHLVYHLVVAC